ncbi:HTH-type transcriptional regulator galR (Galactose operon repressor) [Vibrio nigripulchritudo MADA3029]|uniref:HTH-type transcriptional regulator galR (Galactose operon repressor) n=1 Tax=Vibrio nigripulchritudo SOn1 TaxID=1238450 RepID=A0AAV2VTQ4_9VIBR|nr:MULTISPECIES: substrate-binding domain-containing protein [Vibrio]EGU57392.1 transcriptional repressor RbsR [Vibrio nigripulchritudo ATCC 27043]KJY72099.1 transcriptional regulator [Vibrio nigripulchritudo]UAB72602.1 substrate-binding domain-containing protein [Vibrio sp. SCSIO 43132]CCN36749.1 HTH-type transcriptional regulator galR (Galactose operon repressor) [Vibrio nigripulchritudo AM115]CCN44156.1 HTH-type transcriptional regulator galR (Galactose operon repressor) [Vibrio nigripulchr
MATIKDVAKAAGVSVATVSRVINRSPKASQKAIESVSQAMAQLGYRPNANARALVSQSTNTMGVLVSDVSDPFFGTLIKAVDDVAHTRGKHLLIGNGYHNADEEREAIELLVNSRCESLIIHAKGLTDEELLSYTKEVPGMVLINRHIPAIAHRCIALDNYKGAYLATEYLIRHGHKNIACISSSHHIEDVDARVSGYLAALRDHNIELSDRYIVHRNPDSEGGEDAMTHLLTQSLPISAVFAYNDYMAAGAMSILEENGLDVPENVSMIGFDDGPIAKYLSPKLTTIRYPIQMMAEQAARLSLALADGEKIDSESVVLSPTLVRRNSVDKVRD